MLKLVTAVRRGVKRAAARQSRAFPFLVLALMAGLALTQAYGQETEDSLTAELQAGDRGELAYHQATGLVRFYGAGSEAYARALQAAASGVSAQAEPRTVALSFLDTYGSLFGVHSPTKELALDRETAADRGRSFLRYQQLYQGVPVMAGELIVQVAAGTVLSANGEVAPIESLSVEPNLSAAEALERALALVAKGSGLAADQLEATEPELWVYDPRLLTPYDMPASLVWRTEVSSAEGMLHQMVLIDAHLGAVVLQLDLVETALNRAIYDSSNVRRDALPGITLVRTEGQGPSAIADANLAYDYFGDAYAFFQSYHGRDSYDGLGAQLKATVRYCPQDTQYACPYPNAFWNGYYRQFAFGQDMLADDVAAHEYTHAVTQFTSGLYYMYQSGAINESLSDIWGEFIDLTNVRGNDGPPVRWLVGEDLPIEAIRSMMNPPAFGQPDTMTSGLWECDPNFDDQGGVHANSGVLNKAAYLITDGGSFSGQSITGLGIAKTANIFYELQTNRLTSGSDFLDVSSLLPHACDSLVGSSGITTADCQQVRTAVAATEMTETPAECGLTEAPLCPTGYGPSDLFFDDLENPTSDNWAKQVVSSIYQVWSYPQNPNPLEMDMTNATSGVTNFWGYDLPAVSDSAIAMTNSVPLPVGKAAYLRFNHSYTFEYVSGGAYDGSVVQYSANGGPWQDGGVLFDHNGYNGVIYAPYDNPLAGRPAFVATSHGYTSSRMDLTPLAGQTVRVRFRIGTDSAVDDYGWFIDDIRIYTCDPILPTATASPTGTATPVTSPTSTATAEPTRQPTGTATATATVTPASTATATPPPTPVLNYVPLLMSR